MGLVVVAVFGVAGKFQVAVGQQGGLRRAGGAGSKVERGFIFQVQRDIGRNGFGRGQKGLVMFREIRRLFEWSDENIKAHRVVQIGFDFVDPVNKFFPEYDGPGFGGFRAAQNRLGHEPEIERYRPGTGAQNAEITWQPFDTVHHQVHDPLAPCDAAGQQGLSDLIGLVVKGRPGDLGAFLFSGRAFDQRGFVTVHAGVAGQDFGDDHGIGFLRAQLVYAYCHCKSYKAHCRRFRKTFEIRVT